MFYCEIFAIAETALSKLLAITSLHQWQWQAPEAYAAKVAPRDP